MPCGRQLVEEEKGAAELLLRREIAHELLTLADREWRKGTDDDLVREDPRRSGRRRDVQIKDELQHALNRKRLADDD